jgi:hypothetical protein
MNVGMSLWLIYRCNWSEKDGDKCIILKADHFFENEVS